MFKYFRHPNFQWTHNKGLGILLSQDEYCASYTYDKHGNQTKTSEYYYWRFEIRFGFRTALILFPFKTF